MARFAANISLLFTELPFLDRISAAADAGFEGIEILFPYDLPAKDIRRQLIATGLPLVLINCPPPNYTGGPRGFAAMPDRIDRFQTDFRRACRFAQELGAQRMHVMAGDGSGQAAADTFIDNLIWAAENAGGLPLTIEPLNPVAMPGYFLNDYDLAAQVLAAVNRPDVGLQFDTYHAEVIHDDVMAQWDRHSARVTHVQIGSAPDRSEPDTPLFPRFFERLAADGYDGWISAEYHPRTETAQGLGWFTGFGQA